MSYSVSEVNHMAAELFAAHPTFNAIQVHGEISGGKLYPSGHYYFTLKDENSSVSCVMFRSAYNRIKFKPENGTKVSLTANVSIYEKAGRFQLIVQTLKPQGIGDLHQQFELLKKELATKGYFSEQRKKPIPRLPNIIGVATSAAGAVIQDIIHVLRRRFPGFKMHFIPVAVQGEGAAEQIAAAINIFNQRNEVDLIVIARGGGSIEDLWAFNERVLADSIFSSIIPIVSAVGHETDFTIADFVADLRAPTPSAAAELIVPEKDNLYQILENEQDKLKQILNNQLSNAKSTLSNLINRPVFTQPTQIIDQKRQLVDDTYKRLIREFKHQTIGRRQIVGELKGRLILLKNNSLQNKRQELNHLKAKLDALSPLSVLKRGYTYIDDLEEKIIDSSLKIRSGQIVNIHWHDGSVQAEVKVLQPDLTEDKKE